MLVSVVMPSYNHAAYCVEAAQSVLGQSHRRLELIVVDDGSRDDLVERLAALDDPRLHLVTQENRGAHAAINRGLDLAQGDYLAIINSDDRFDPRRIETCLRAMDAEGSDLACSCDPGGRRRGERDGGQARLAQHAPRLVPGGGRRGLLGGRGFRAEPAVVELRLDHLEHALPAHGGRADRRHAQPALRP